MQLPAFIILLPAFNRFIQLLKKGCLYFIIAACIFLFVPCCMYAQTVDTLQELKLFSIKPIEIAHTNNAVQQLNRAALAKLNSISVADAVKYFPGVVVKDYGGIGGLKTISVRSLGANQTAVMYDGIMVSDAQGGQIDLGRFSLDNIESIHLYNSQPPDILLPARSYSSASVIALSSVATDKSLLATTSFSATVKAGSFGLFNPAFSIKNKIAKNTVQSISAEHLQSKGNYRFVDYETGGGSDRRNSADIKSNRIEYDLTHTINDSNHVQLKAYYYDSKRGLPGSVILYNPVSGERLNNKSFFTQLSFLRNLSIKSKLLLSAKYAADNKFYLDPSYLNVSGKLENEFKQHEYYLSAAYSYAINAAFSVAYAADFFINKLKRTDTFALAFANPTRNTLLNNFSVQWKKKWIGINGNLLHTNIRESVEYGPAAKSLQQFTPAFSVSIKPLNQLPLRIRASYKNIFRPATFNDLYYTNIGNTLLRPEFARQYNLGITMQLQPKKFIKDITLTADGYYNRVKDKILAVPRQNLFQWSMQNVGKVNIKGTDVAMQVSLVEKSGMEMSFNMSYSFQQARDISDPGSVLYKTQLPYTPKHSGSANINAGYKQWIVSYNIIASSNRYRLGDPIPENLVKGWATHDVSLSYIMKTKKSWRYKMLAEVNNIYNKQYEVIRYYPMPGINYRLGINAFIKK